MAVLDLLSEVAADAPLLVIAEDAHWLDRPSSDVLAFVARRLESDPIVLAGRRARRVSASSLVDAGLPEHRLGALDPANAAELLDASAQQLTRDDAQPDPARGRRQPAGAHRAADRRRRAREQGTPMPGLLPLTERLEQAFAARVSDLPEETRLLLLVAALNDEERLSEVLRRRQRRRVARRWTSTFSSPPPRPRSSTSTSKPCASATR